jgi:hypothetical protein
MKYNLDRSFVGITQLVQTHHVQIAKFEEWAAKNDWDLFHHSHYDWWTFPINRPSSYGLKWTVYEGEISELKKDNGFTQSYCRGVQLISASWGWDVLCQSAISNPKPEQSWHHWPVRLFKAALSVQLFGYDELFASLKRYAQGLIARGEPMDFNSHDLSWLFTTGIDPYPNANH